MDFVPCSHLHLIPILELEQPTLLSGKGMSLLLDIASKSLRTNASFLLAKSKTSWPSKQSSLLRSSEISERPNADVLLGQPSIRSYHIEIIQFSNT